MAIYVGVSEEQKLAILRRTNISVDWLTATTKACRLFDCDLGIRASQALAMNSTVPGVGKPSSYKAKTVKTGLAAGCIPERSAYQEIYGVKLSAADIAETPETSPIRINLSSILSGTVGPNPRFKTKTVGDLLYVEELTDPAHAKDVYAINLKDSRAYPETSENALHQTPDWWKDEWGKFSAVADSGFSMSYAVRKPGEENYPPEQLKFKEYRGYSIDGEQIIYDTDPAGTVRSLSPAKNSLLAPPPSPPESAVQTYNTFTPEGRQKMLQALIELHKFACKKDLDTYNNGRPFSLDDIPSEAIIGRWGCLQPYEAYFIHCVNLRTYEQQTHPVKTMYDEKSPTPNLTLVHARGKLKHGSENLNPGHSIGIVPMILVTRNGELVYAETNQDVVKYFLENPEYLKKNFFVVHHEWDMRIWGDVIARQLEYGQKEMIPEKTLTAYVEYLAGVNLLKHHQDVLRVGSEAKLIDALMQDNTSLTRYRIQVQPSWDMEQWAPVVAKQIALSHTILSPTLLAFFQHQYAAKTEDDLVRKILGDDKALPQVRVQADWSTALWAPFLIKQVAAEHKLEKGVTKNLIAYLKSVQTFLQQPNLSLHSCKKKFGLLDQDNLQTIEQMRKFIADNVSAVQYAQIEPYRVPTTAETVMLFSRRSGQNQPHAEVTVKAIDESFDFTDAEKLTNLKNFAKQQGWHFNANSNSIYFRDQEGAYGVQIHPDHLSAEMSSPAVKKVMAQITHHAGLQFHQLNITGKIPRNDFAKEYLAISAAGPNVTNKHYTG